MIVRTGKVTSIYPDEGKVIVHYDDADTTSGKLPLMNYNNELCIPPIGTMVLTLHMENNKSNGFVLGPYFNKCNLPAHEPFYKNFGTDAYMIYTEGQLVMHAPEIIFECDAGTISMRDIIEHINPS